MVYVSQTQAFCLHSHTLSPIRIVLFILVALLAEIRQNDRQPPTEELIEDIPKTRSDYRPDYQAIRDRILKSLTTGRGSFASTSPQFRAASRALDRFINEIEGDPKAPKSD